MRTNAAREDTTPDMALPRISWAGKESGEELKKICMGRLISSFKAIYFELQNTNCEDLCRRYNSACMRAHATRRASIAIFFHPPPQSVHGNPGHNPAKCCSNSRANASVRGLQLEKLLCAEEGAAVEGTDAEKTHSGVFAEQGEFAYLLSCRCVCVSVCM